MNRDTSSDFELAVRESSARHLASTEGPAGMAQLLDRIEPHLSQISAAWKARDFSALGLALRHCANASDAADLRASDFKLRCIGQTDTLVLSKIYEALIEALARGEDADIFEAVKDMALMEEAPSLIGFFGSPMRLLLIRLQLHRGLTAEAVATANGCLALFSTCPHAQRYLYLANLQHRKAGGMADSADVALQDLSDRFCSQPFTTLASPSGRTKRPFPNLMACHCPGILPYPVSDGSETQSVDDIWNGDAIQEIRRSVLDGDFIYCSRFNCPDIIGGNLPKKGEIAEPRLRDIIDNHKVVLDDAPLMLSLSHDSSCNLACPSCRKELFAIRNEQREVLDRFSEGILLPLMEDAPTSLVLSGDGDPFGSKHYRQLMRSLDPVRHSKVRILFLTNGLLLTKREWEELSNIHGMVASVAVSIDAAEAATYEDLRRPGKWSVICENMEHLGQLRRSGIIPYLAINFVIQQKNYRQIPAFIRLGKQWGVDIVRFLKLINVGVFSSDAYMENNVCNPSHPEYERFLEVLRDPVVLEPEVDLFTAKPYLEIAQSSARVAEAAA